MQFPARSENRKLQQNICCGQEEGVMFLTMQGIRKSFGAGESRVEVLRGLDLEVERGEFCVLLGPSGSGKSTLLNIIGGIDGADEGSITIDGERLENMTEKNCHFTAGSIWAIFFRCTT